MKKINSKHRSSEPRRREIIQAALACFTEKGINEAGIAEICSRSGASTGSVYHHFGGKEQLAAAVYVEGIRDYQAGFLRVLEEQDDAKEGIFAVVRYHLEWVYQNPDWAKYLFETRRADFMDAFKEDFRNANGEFLRRVTDWFRQHVKAGTLRRIPPDIYASILLGPCQEFSRCYLTKCACTDLKEAARELGQAAWRSLRTPPRD
jgi:AcrR family transcriptional regulator